MGWRKTAIGALCVAMWLFGSVASAQDANAVSADDEEARILFSAGQRAYDAGHYDRALEHFRRSYELSGRPALLYNIGQAADRLRHDREALEAFEQFLATDGVEPDLRRQLEARVASLRAALVDSAGREEVATNESPSGIASDPTSSSATDGSDRTGSDGAGIALLIAGPALMVGGAVMLGVAVVEGEAVRNAPMSSSWRDYAGRADAANGLMAAGPVALGIGAALVVVGAIVLTSQPSAEAEVAIGPGSISLRGAF